MRRVIVLPFLIAWLFSLVPVVSAPSPLTETVVRLDPATIELGPEYCVGEIFTLEFKVDDVEELMALALEITWNTTYLEYVSHIVTMPVEDYPNGILHEYVGVDFDIVDELQGTYNCVAQNYGGTTFNGSGTAFEIVLRVKYQPNATEPSVTFPIKITYHVLDNPVNFIPHSLQNCNVTIHAYPNWNIADVNGDLKVDIFDVLLCANAYQATPSDPNWNSRCDITEPFDLIDIFDIVMICVNYGEEYTP